jgi:plasmid replication initiation protein
MTSSYAIKLYKLLYQYRNIKKRVFTVIELKEQFGIVNKYPQYSNFKQRILTPSIIQINKLTDLYISFDEIKMGRSVDRLEFNFSMQDKPKKSTPFMIKPEIIIENKKISELIKDIEIELSTKTKELIVKMFQLNGVEYIEASINYAKKNAKSNIDKYLNDTLNNNWAEIEFNRITEKKDKQNQEQQLINQQIEEKEQKLRKEQEVKLFLEDMWQNLTSEEKTNYITQSNELINKYEQLTRYFDEIDRKLPICLFAIANNTSYDRMLEGYCKNILNIF